MAVQINPDELISRAVKIGTRLINVVLPAQCIHCGELTANPGGLCPACWPNLSFIEEPLCDRSGVPFAYDPGPGIFSAQALARPPVWHRARAAVEYNDTSRALIHALKYHDRHEVVDLMAQTMTGAARHFFADADLVIPVPLYPSRLWHRRFNQSAMLARQIAQRKHLPFRSDILLRARQTRQQVGLRGAERRKNVKGAFEIDPQHGLQIKNANIILIDDVITTGATVGACSEVLLRAGCHRVDVVAFALVNNPLRLNI
jgi:ComF family protein